MMGIGNNQLMKKKINGRPQFISNTKNFVSAFPYTLILTKPIDVVAGDLLLILLASDGATSDIRSTSVATFTHIQNGTFSSSGCQYGAFWRIADGTEASTLTPTFYLTFARAGFYVHIKGANATTPIGNVSATGGTSASTSATYTGVTGDIDDLGIFVEAFEGGDGAPFTISGGSWTKADDIESGASSGVSGCFATLIYSATTAVSVTSVSAVSDGHSGCQFRIKK